MKRYRVTAQVEYIVTVPDAALEAELVDLIDDSDTFILPESITLDPIDEDNWDRAIVKNVAAFNGEGDLVWRS